MALFDALDYDPIFGHARKARQEWRNPLPEEQVQGLGEQVKNAGLTGLSWVGSALDKPGRAARGLLAGKPRELLNLIPFSDSLGATREKDFTSGADLNKQYLGIRNNNSWKSWGAGLATELVTDPLNAAAFLGGAANTMGRAAAKGLASGSATKGALQGWTRKALMQGFEHTEPELRALGPHALAHAQRQGKRIASDDLVAAGVKANQPLSGIMRIKVPFRPDIGKTVGTGPVAQAVAGVAGTALDKTLYKVPGMKTLSAAFGDVRGAPDEVGQRMWRSFGSVNKRDADIANRHFDRELGKMIHGAVGQGFNEDELARAAIARARGIVPAFSGPSMSAVASGPTAPLAFNPHTWAAAEPIATHLRSRGAQYLQEAAEQGAGPSAHVDPFAPFYTARQGLLKKSKIGATPPGRILPMRTAAEIKRKKVLTNTPGGELTLNRLASDPRLTGVGRAFTPAAVRAHILETFINQANQQGVRLPQLTKRGYDAAGNPTTTMLTHEDQLLSQAKKLTKYLGKREVGPIFDPSLAATQNLREARRGLTQANAKTAYEGLGEMARPMQAGMVPVTTMAQRLGLKNRQGGPLGLQGANVELHKALAKQGLPVTEEYMDTLMAPVHLAATPADALKEIKNAQRQLRRDVSKFGVTPEQAEQLTRSRAKWSTADEMVAPKNAWTSFTNAFRKLAYSAWVTSHARNVPSSELQSFTTTGVHGQQRAALRALENRVKPGELQKIPGLTGLSDKDATVKLLDWANEYGDIGHGHAELLSNQAQTKSGLRTPPLLGTLPPVPNMYVHAGKAFGGTLKELWDKTRHPIAAKNPFRMEGVGKGVEDFPMVKAGQEIGAKVEQRARLGQMMDLLQKGYAPPEAGRQMLRSQFDYSALTPFERRYMRTAFPFYVFQSRNLPLQLRTIMENPAASSAQLRLASGSRNEFVPQHLASGVAIPTGDEHEGNRQYISQLGIPIEEAFERFKYDPNSPVLGTAKNTALAYAGGLNPLIKGGLEQLFNTQFFSGRKLTDLRPQGAVGGLGRLIDPEHRHDSWMNLVAQGVANTPGTRFLTTLDKFIDPRKPLALKALNLLSGVRVSDVDMDRTRAIEMRKALEAALQGNPAISHYTNAYVKPENAHLLRPEDIEKLRALSTLQARAQEFANHQRQMAALGKSQP